MLSSFSRILVVWMGTLLAASCGSTPASPTAPANPSVAASTDGHGEPAATTTHDAESTPEQEAAASGADRSSEQDPAASEERGTDDALVSRCEANDGAACFELGDRPDATPEQRAYLTRACELDYGKACAKVAVQHVRGGDAKQAVSALERGCKAGAATACTMLGEAYWHGKDGLLGLQISKGKARSYHERAWKLERAACDAGDGGACGAVGLALINGRTGHNAGSGIAVPKNVAKGKALRVKACEELRHAETCRALAFDSHTSDPAAAERYRARACELGIADLCAR